MPRQGTRRKKIKLSEPELNQYEKEIVIEHLREEYKSKPIELLDSLDNEILKQVALEGLSGTTFGRLLYILEAVCPHSNATTDKNCQNHIWSVITNCYLSQPEDVGIKMFYLQDSTTTPASTNQTPVVTVDKSIKLPQQTVQRLSKVDHIYPVQQGHIMGSCENYLTRTDITEEVIQVSNSHPSGLQELLSVLNNRYSLDRVYLVAGQLSRSRVLLPNWTDPNVDIKLREYCTLELIGKTRTRGIVFPNDKTLGRYRIMLMAKGFICQYQETSSSPIEHHITRYSRPSPAPTCDSPSAGGNKLKTDCSSDEEEKKQSGTRIRLAKLCSNPNKLKLDRGILASVYDVIANSDKGVTQIQLRQKLQLPKFHLRNHLKNLLSLEMICSHISKDQFRIYKTAHKSPANARRRKKKRQLAVALAAQKAKGIMAKWDERDLRAKKIIGHKRSSFSQAEDSMLILCRIASLLIEPRLKLSWCVHKRLVRDIVHDELPELAKDKTSDACLRRIKYLKRLTNNIMSINELTAELRDDRDICRLMKRVPNSKQPLENDEKLNKFFIQVLKLVRDKTPNLLNSTSARVAGSQQKEILDYVELNENYQLVDCQSGSGNVRRASGLLSSRLLKSGSLLQLAFPISENYLVDLNESNQISSIALLTSVCSSSCFQMNLELKIPANVVALDQGNESFRIIREKANEKTKQILARFMSPCDTINEADQNDHSDRAPFVHANKMDSPRALFLLRHEIKSQALSDCLIVQPCNVRFFCDDPFKGPLEAAATSATTTTAAAAAADEPSRLSTLGNLVLSWIIMFPGIERDLLEREFGHLASADHLFELLELMESLYLIESQLVEFVGLKPRLFGYKKLDEPQKKNKKICYQATASSYVRFCQLLK